MTGGKTDKIVVGPAIATQVSHEAVADDGHRRTGTEPVGLLAVEDSFGNVVTGDSSSVVVTVATGPGGFATGSTTRVAAAGGVATFSNLVFDTAGGYTLRVSDGGLTGATTGTIRQSGDGQQIGLRADAYERHRRTGADSLDHLGRGRRFRQRGHRQRLDGDGRRRQRARRIRSRKHDRVAAASGVATFSNLVLDTAGNYTLSVSDGGLTGAAAGRSRQPGRGQHPVVRAGAGRRDLQAGVRSLQVAVKDDFGNVITGDTSTVTVTVARGPSGPAVAITTP